RDSKDVLLSVDPAGQGNGRSGRPSRPVEVWTGSAEQRHGWTSQGGRGVRGARVDRNHAVSPLQKRQERPNRQTVGNVVGISDPRPADNSRVETALRASSGEQQCVIRTSLTHGADDLGPVILRPVFAGPGAGTQPTPRDMSTARM